MERRGQPDHLLFFITMALLVIGLIMVLSASSYDALLHYDDAFYFFKKQLFNCLLGLVALIAMMVVKPEVISDEEMTLVARNIVEKIEQELEYPGQIKVNLIRETRTVDYAK